MARPRYIIVALSVLVAIGLFFGLMTSARAAAVTWNNGGIGDGVTWDTTQLNWNTGTAAFTTGDLVTFDNSGIANKNISVPASISAGSITAIQTGATAAATTYNISVAPGQTLTSTGAVTIGQTATTTSTIISLKGGGNFSQTGGNLVLSLTNGLGNPGPGGILDASGLA